MAGLFTAATFRTLGAAATPQTLFSFENTSGSAVIVKIRRLVIQMDATAVLVAVMPQFKTSRCAVPTGGTVIAKAQTDTANASVANVIVRGATASDGGVATAITATPGTVLWQQYAMRMHTVVGQVLAPDNNLLPALIETRDFVIRANEAICVQCVASIGTSNPATNHYFINVAWDEV